MTTAPAPPTESLPTMPARALVDGDGTPGTMLVDTVPAHFTVARALGFGWTRAHPGWNGVQRFDGSYDWTSVDRFVDRAIGAGLKPIVVTGYGPVWRPLATKPVLREAVPAGSTVLPVDSVAGVRPLFCSVHRDPAGTVPPLTGITMHFVPEGKWGYEGALLHDVRDDPPALVLAHPTSTALPAGAVLVVNERPWAPPATTHPDEPGVAAFVDYAVATAGRLASRPGFTEGAIEIWNEGPWARAPWDCRYKSYPTGGPFPAGVEAVDGGCNWGIFRRLLRDVTLPAGVCVLNGFSHKSGFNNWLGGRAKGGAAGTWAHLFTRENVERLRPHDAIHPYSSTPEWHGHDPTKAGYPALVGVNQGSNFKGLKWSNDEHRRTLGWGPDTWLTEYGDAMPEPHRTRHHLRSFLYYQGVGYRHPVFYTLAGTATATAMVDAATLAPFPVGDALRGLLDLCRSFGPPEDAPPAPGTGVGAGALPEVTALAGASWPVMTRVLTGRVAGDDRDGAVLILWQRTYPGATGLWKDLPRPPAASVTVRVPPWCAVDVHDLVTRQSVAADYTVAERVTLPVTDDPVAVVVRPVTVTEVRVRVNGVEGWMERRAFLEMSE